MQRGASCRGLHTAHFIRPHCIAPHRVLGTGNRCGSLGSFSESPQFVYRCVRSVGCTCSISGVPTRFQFAAEARGGVAKTGNVAAEKEASIRSHTSAGRARVKSKSASRTHSCPISNHTLPLLRSTRGLMHQLYPGQTHVSNRLAVCAAHRTRQPVLHSLSPSRLCTRGLPIRRHMRILYPARFAAAALTGVV